ncbi:amidase [Poseidonocella sp. HB161398]|uniref:amidase n=1 Tax=Poseidonocella sp. HB161398 TaxID=2320855 RepID=UPI001108933D|nr:amidase [Poseidonocella sp. HB161398]
MERQADADHGALTERFSLGGSGLTVAVKDCIDIAGHVTACGSAALRGRAPAARNADVVDSLLAAGCRIIGKAAMHELAFGMTGVNAAFGTPVNPRWPDRIPGGSSSGSAVAVAAGLCDFAVGTDTGGSVRQPAACCGLWGIKPSFGRISRRGATPAESSLDCIGAFARDGGMLVRAMEAMDPGFAPATPGAAPVLLQLDAGLPGIATAELPGLDAAFAAGMTLIAIETEAAFGHLLDAGAAIGPDIAARLAAAREIPAGKIAAAERIRAAFTAEVDALLERCDAIVTPALAGIPPTLAGARDPQSVLGLTRYQRPFNLSGHPAIVLPRPGPGGLPAGLQIIGRKGDDARLCAIAIRLAESLQTQTETA